MDGAASNIPEGLRASIQPECAICLQPFLYPVQLPCRCPFFCYLCAKGAVQRYKRCPLCQKEVSLSYLDNPRLLPFRHPPVTFEGSYQWFYEGLDGWWQYDSRTSSEIEDAYQRGEPQCEVLIAGYLYIVNFEENFQVRRCNPCRRRRIKRDLVTTVKKGVAGIDLNTFTRKYPST